MEDCGAGVVEKAGPIDRFQLIEECAIGLRALGEGGAQSLENGNSPGVVEHSRPRKPRLILGQKTIDDRVVAEENVMPGYFERSSSKTFRRSSPRRTRRAARTTARSG